jgi:hypothetical protein
MTVNKIKVPCNRCKIKTNHLVLFSSSDEDVVEINGERHFLSVTTYKVVSCNGCESVTFLKTEGYPNFYELDKSRGGLKSGYKEVKYYFPERVIFLLEEKKFVGMSPELKLIYREVIDGFNHGQRVLCAVGLRTLVEGTCKFLKLDGKNLNEMIKNMEASEHLSKSLINSLDSHRYLGNKAVHEFQIPEKEELIHAIELVEQMLNLIFNIPDRAQRLKELIENRKFNDFKPEENKKSD